MCNIRKDEVRYEEINCDDLEHSADVPVMMNCEVRRLSQRLYSGFGDFSNFSHNGTGLKTVVEMKQCVARTKLLSEGSTLEGKPSEKELEYSLKWNEFEIASFYVGRGGSSGRPVCGGHTNPRWPSAVPSGTLTEADEEIYVGKFVSTLAYSLPMETPVNWPAPAGWEKVGSYFETKKWSVDPGPGGLGIGDMRVRFTSNDPRAHAILLGKNMHGKIVPFKLEESQTCGGMELHKLKVAAPSEPNSFQIQFADNTREVWMWRCAWCLLTGTIAFCWRAELKKALHLSFRCCAALILATVLLMVASYRYEFWPIIASEIFACAIIIGGVAIWQTCPKHRPVVENNVRPQDSGIYVRGRQKGVSPLICSENKSEQIGRKWSKSEQIGVFPKTIQIGTNRKKTGKSEQIGVNPSVDPKLGAPKDMANAGAAGAQEARQSQASLSVGVSMPVHLASSMSEQHPLVWQQQQQEDQEQMSPHAPPRVPFEQQLLLQPHQQLEP